MEPATLQWSEWLSVTANAATVATPAALVLLYFRRRIAGWISAWQSGRNDNRRVGADIRRLSPGIADTLDAKWRGYAVFLSGGFMAIPTVLWTFLAPAQLPQNLEAVFWVGAVAVAASAIMMITGIGLLLRATRNR